MTVTDYYFELYDYSISTDHTKWFTSMCFLASIPLPVSAKVKHILNYLQTKMSSYKFSVEQYYNTGIIINYQLQIPLHFGGTIKTSPVNITSIFLHKPLTTSSVIFLHM